jgi:ATP-dependent helicase HrpA
MMRNAGLEMALTYHFEPGSLRDGVTLAIPLFALNQVSAARCAWLVPGMLKEKTHLLLKSLPQKLRRHCVPIPDYAAGFCERLAAAKKFGHGELLDALIADIRQQTTIAVAKSDFKPETLSAHHFMNFKVIDEHGRQLEMGRNLAQLQSELGLQAREQFQKLAEQNVPANEQAEDNQTKKNINDELTSSISSAKKQSGSVINNAAYQQLTTWSFGELPELLEIQQGKQTLIGYPALVDRVTHCDLEVFDDPSEAAILHVHGLRRLFALQLKEQLKYLEKNVPGLQQMGMQFMSLGSQEELRDQIIQAGLTRACLQEPLPKNSGEFNTRRDEGKARLNLLVNEIARLVGQILAEFHGLPKKLKAIKSAPQVQADMHMQLQQLIGARFVLETEHTQLAHFPRYLKAMQVRLDKWRADPARDTRLMAEWQQAAMLWQRAAKTHATRDPKMQEYRWMLEELRVSLFAQELKTPMPVSAKRLQKMWEAMQR